MPTATELLLQKSEELHQLYQLQAAITERVWAGSDYALELVKDVDGNFVKGEPLTEENIKSHVKRVADEIFKEYGTSGNPVLLGILDGGAKFTVMLSEALDKLGCKHSTTYMQVSSYGHGLTAGKLVIKSEPKEALCGRHVIVTDDVLDSGQTMAAVTALLRKLYHGQNEHNIFESIKSAVLVDKYHKTRPNGCNADFVGFTVSKEDFIIGCGLDYLDMLREKLSVKSANLTLLATPEEEAKLAKIDSLIADIKDLRAQIEQANSPLTVSDKRNSTFCTPHPNTPTGSPPKQHRAEMG